MREGEGRQVPDKYGAGQVQGRQMQGGYRAGGERQVQGRYGVGTGPVVRGMAVARMG